jgi:hypothetical protein
MIGTFQQKMQQQVSCKNFKKKAQKNEMKNEGKEKERKKREEAGFLLFQTLVSQ